MRRNRKLIVFFSLIFCASLLPISPSGLTNLFSQVEADDSESISGTEIWDQDKTINKNYTVLAGATLIIKKGITISFAEGGSIGVLGKLFISGTLNDPIKIKKTEDSWGGYSIGVSEGGEIYARNAIVSDGGSKVCMLGKNTLFDTAQACYFYGAIQSQYGKLDIQNVSFKNNAIGIAVFGKSNSNMSDIRVNRSEFLDNSLYDVYTNGFTFDLDFKYNWWGDSGGPIKTCENNHCWYEKLWDNVDFSSWRTEKDFHDPVIIVPGIIGSAKKDGNWIIDPVGHIYDNLYAEFANNGYVAEKDLFTFGYDWENSNVDTANLLKQKIQDIKEKTHWTKVDIVAHSMGGLVARYYVESDNYNGDVDQLITLGTPNNGAPEAYLKWEGNIWTMGMVDLYAHNVMQQEIRESDGKYVDGFEYIHNRPVASLQELLPVYNYLQDAENNYENKIYSTGYPKNEFLENLNKDENVEKLNNIEFDKIIGNTKNDKATIAGFKVAVPGVGKLWMDGFPVGFNRDNVGDMGMFYSTGDETVPVYSSKSENISADYTKEINSVHAYLPTASQKDVLELLTNERPSSEVNELLPHHWLFGWVFSPIDIQIIAPDGVHWIGKNIKNLPEGDQIEGAFYTGSDTENEFVSIPNPEPGEYTVVRQGTGSGEYTVEMTNIQEAQDGSGQASESTTAITGSTSEGKEEESNVKVSSLIMNDENTSGASDDSSNDDSGHSNKSKKKKSTSSSDTSSASGTAEDSLISERWNIDQKLFPNKNGSSFNENEEDVNREALNEKNPVNQKEATYFWHIIIAFLAVIAILLGGGIYFRRKSF